MAGVPFATRQYTEHHACHGVCIEGLLSVGVQLDSNTFSVVMPHWTLSQKLHAIHNIVYQNGFPNIVFVSIPIQNYFYIILIIVLIFTNQQQKIRKQQKINPLTQKQNTIALTSINLSVNTYRQLTIHITRHFNILGTYIIKCVTV